MLGVDCTAYFQSCETTIMPSLPHNSGVVVKNENKLNELLEVLKYYHSAVPKTSDNELDQKLCFGQEM